MDRTHRIAERSQEQVFADAPIFSTEQTLSSRELEALSRVFNSAVVSTQVEAQRSFSQEMLAVMGQAEFRSILVAVAHLAQSESVSDKVAAERIVTAFRKLDSLWGSYLKKEGAGKIQK